jgi:Phosphatidylinositol 3- and 4-kinase
VDLRCQYNNTSTSEANHSPCCGRKDNLYLEVSSKKPSEMTPQVPNVFTLQVQELSQDSNVYSVPVRWFTKIKDVKDLLHSITKIAPSRQQLFQSNSSIPLSSSLTMHDLKISKSGQSLRLSINDVSILGATDHVLNRSGDTLLDEECSRMLTDVRFGLQRHNVPIKTDVLDCTGGVYFMRGVSGRKIAVFKPQDEEQGMPNNTKGYEGSGEIGLRPFYKPGYGCMREVAAYLMDVDNFCCVPPTSLVHFQHPILNYPGRGGRMGHPFPKVGSLQKFIHAFDSFEDIGISVLSDLEVQKIALLDLRLLNCDRNASNILAIHKDFYREDSSTGFKGSKCSGEEEFDFSFDDVAPVKAEGSGGDLYTLIPIDHGYCLPSKLLVNEIDWAWFYYPQVNRPIQQEIKDYVQKIDIEATLKIVKSVVEVSEDAIFLARISHLLVVDGIKAGLNLHEIAMIVARLSEETPSPLEKAIEEAEENAHRTIEMRVGGISRLGKFKDNSADGTFWKSSTEKTHVSPKLHRKRVSEAEKQACFLPYTHPSLLIKAYDRDSDRTDSSAQSSQSDDSSFAQGGDASNYTLALPDDIGFNHKSSIDPKDHIDFSHVMKMAGNDVHSENAQESRLEVLLETEEMYCDKQKDIIPSKDRRGSLNIVSEKGMRSPDSGPRVSFARDTKAHGQNLPLLAPRISSYKMPVDFPSPARLSSPPLPTHSTAHSTGHSTGHSAVKSNIGALIQSAPVTPMQTSSYFSRRPSVPLFDSFPEHCQLDQLPLPPRTLDFEPYSEASSVSDTASSVSTSSVNTSASTASVSSVGGAPAVSKGMYYKNLHGQPLQSIQSENDSIRSTQGTGLKRMNAVNYHLTEDIAMPTSHMESRMVTSSQVSNPAITWQRSVSNDGDGNSSSCNTTDSDAASELFASTPSEWENEEDSVVRVLPPHLLPHHTTMGMGAKKEVASDRTLPSNFKKLALNPPRALHHAHQTGSVDQLRRGIDSSEGEEECEGDGYRPHDDDDMGGTDSDDSPQASPLAMAAMIRVTSFSAFSSAPIYESEDAERRVGKLKKERRRQVAVTEEFGRLRLLFAKNSIASLVAKALKKRHTNSF